MMVAVFVPGGPRRAVSAVVGCRRVRGRVRLRGRSSTSRARTATAIVADSMYRDRWAATRAGARSRAAAPSPCSSPTGERMRDEHIAEYFALLTAAGAGMAFFVQAANLMTLFLGLEWFSIALYVLMRDRHRPRRARSRPGSSTWSSARSGSATLLFGSALVYGATGQLSFDKIARRTATGHDSLLVRRARDDHRRARVQGLGGAVPHVDAGRLPGRADTGDGVHVVGDEDRGARRHLPRAHRPRSRSDEHLWTLGGRRDRVHLARVGNIAALVQPNVKRLLAYSSVSHAGLHADRGRRGAARSARRRSCTT